MVDYVMFAATLEMHAELKEKLNRYEARLELMKDRAEIPDETVSKIIEEFQATKDALKMLENILSYKKKMDKCSEKVRALKELRAPLSELTQAKNELITAQNTFSALLTYGLHSPRTINPPVEQPVSNDSTEPDSYKKIKPRE
jgi:chromosome segregation ATPase